jgi:uncharacterized membrane protein YhaH (DUF805 family)
MEKKKTYVLDTTVLIFDPDIFYKLGDVDIVLPLAAIKELDGLKKSDMEHTAQAARKIARTLDRWGSYADLVAGVKLPTNAKVYIYTDYDNIDGLESQADNKIVGAASKIKREKDTDVILVTTDTNMRTVARAYGIKAEYTHNMKEEGVQKNSSNYKIPKNMIDKKITFMDKVNTFLKITLLFLIFWLAIAFPIMTISFWVWKDFGLSIVIVLCLIAPLSILSILASMPQLVYHQHIYMIYYNNNLQPGQKSLKYSWRKYFRNIARMNFHYDRKYMDDLVGSSYNDNVNSIIQAQ